VLEGLLERVERDVMVDGRLIFVYFLVSSLYRNLLLDSLRA
jgi:hypothetical protein